MNYDPLDDDAEMPRTAYSSLAVKPPETSQLSADLRMRVAIIGGGFTGLATALFLAERNVDCVVLEANDIGWGASGRAFAQVVPWLKNSAEHAEQTFGPVFGPRMVSAAGGAPELLFRLAQTHGFDCGAVRKGLLLAAHSPKSLPMLEARARFWAARGEDVRMLDKVTAAGMIGGTGYYGALFDARGGVINPLSYARELARVAIAHGAKIFTKTRVVKLNKENGGWKLDVQGAGAASVSADQVVLCTNAYTGKLWNEWTRSIIPMRSYAAISRPLSENVRQTILPGGQPLSDTSRLVAGIRMYPDGRLHASVDAPRFGKEGKPDLNRLSDRVRRVFPQVGEIQWQNYWSGWIAMTPQMYPQLVEADGLIAGGGYSGRGMALSIVMAQEIARHLTGTPAEDLLFRMKAPKGIPFRPIAQIGAQALLRVKRVQDAADIARYWSNR